MPAVIQNRAMNAEQLAHTLGGKKSGRQWVARCPAHNDSRPSLIIYDGHTAPQVRCLAGCQPLDVIKVLAATGVWDVKGELKGVRRSSSDDDAVAKRNAELAIAIWNKGVDPRGTLAEMYLWGRELLLPDDCSTLRFHPRCPRGRERCPALIAAMYPFTGSALVAIQRVFFSDKGEKLGSMMLGPVGGACMKLTPHDRTFTEACPRLFVCEGLETGLALLQMGCAPQWALGSCGAIERMPVLPGVDELVICADNDPPGLSAAKVCADRWNATSHQRAIIMAPEIEGHDYADDLGVRHDR